MNTISNFTKSTFLVIAICITSNVFSAPSHSSTETLISFELVENANTVLVAWQFEKSERSQVSVQRAGADMQFKTISDIEDSNVKQFIDDQPQEGLSFYRLAVQSADGTTIYYKVLTISR